jgi:hypothetical protein
MLSELLPDAAPDHRRQRRAQPLIYRGVAPCVRLERANLAPIDALRYE